MFVLITSDGYDVSDADFGQSRSLAAHLTSLSGMYLRNAEKSEDRALRQLLSSLKPSTWNKPLLKLHSPDVAKGLCWEYLSDTYAVGKKHAQFIPYLFVEGPAFGDGQAPS